MTESLVIPPAEGKGVAITDKEGLTPPKTINVSSDAPRIEYLTLGNGSKYRIDHALKRIDMEQYDSHLNEYKWQSTNGNYEATLAQLQKQAPVVTTAEDGAVLSAPGAVSGVTVDLPPELHGTDLKPVKASTSKDDDFIPAFPPAKDNKDKK